MKQFLLIIIASLGLCACSNSKQEEAITIYAAASMKSVLDEFVESFSMTTDVKIKTNFASSGTLARQIENGATPDVYFSASSDWMEYVLDKTKLDTFNVLVEDVLVLVCPLGSKIDSLTDSEIKQLFKQFDGRIAIGDERHVPVGKYAAQSLRYLGIYDTLKPRFLQTKDVRSALIMVEMSEVEMGIVYGSAAAESNKVKVVGILPPNSHDEILFSMVNISGREMVANFMDFVADSCNKGIWEKYQFISIGS